MHFLLLWLCMVSPYFTSAELEFIFIPLYKGIMGLFAIYWVGLVNPFCFFFFFFFSLIHYIGLGLLTLLLSFLFIYSLHWVGPVDPSTFFSFPLILLGLTYWAPFYLDLIYAFSSLWAFRIRPDYYLFAHTLCYKPMGRTHPWKPACKGRVSKNL